MNQRKLLKQWTEHTKEYFSNYAYEQLKEITLTAQYLTVHTSKDTDNLPPSERIKLFENNLEQFYPSAEQLSFVNKHAEWYQKVNEIKLSLPLVHVKNQSYERFYGRSHGKEGRFLKPFKNMIFWLFNLPRRSLNIFLNNKKAPKYWTYKIPVQSLFERTCIAEALPYIAELEETILSFKAEKLHEIREFL